MSVVRLSEYRVMWLMVFFDLPTETKQDKREYWTFRKKLLNDGFSMFQFSIYVRHCASAENADVHRKRVQAILPDKGLVGIMCVTDKQFEGIDLFFGKSVSKPQEAALQLELF